MWHKVSEHVYLHLSRNGICSSILSPKWDVEKVVFAHRNVINDLLNLARLLNRSIRFLVSESCPFTLVSWTLFSVGLKISKHSIASQHLWRIKKQEDMEEVLKNKTVVNNNNIDGH